LHIGIFHKCDTRGRQFVADTALGWVENMAVPDTQDEADGFGQMVKYMDDGAAGGDV
jgi:hypothetical protein